MATNSIIEVWAFGTELGKLGYNIDQRKCYFQYSPQFLESWPYPRMFPFIFKKIRAVQVFTEYEGSTFKGLPPMIADSLPDMFGNIIFKEWFEANNKGFDKITPLEQLAYVANRGMGALEYRPIIEIPTTATINIDEVVTVLQKVLDVKKSTSEKNLSHPALLNIFKIGSSAGGARPKILISEHKETKNIIPGDIEYSDDYNHWLVKLCLDENDGYNKEKVEYAYYQLTQKVGIDMMHSELIENRHFATRRYDRQNGVKQHVLTASGLTGWDFMKPENGTYENLFKLALNLKVPHRDIQELFKRMVFNTVFLNYDDHLKNHSFIYHQKEDSWRLGPAYDITYPFNIRLNYLKKSRALSINGKRTGFILKDLLVVAETFAIKNPKGIIQEVQNAVLEWRSLAHNLEIPNFVIEAIEKEFQTFDL
ncbi:MULTISPECIES: type II toxin-antitoxin system HipA family toxin [unclassified Arcicella]|uniref:type II toxin-antitoxin system HipA family toxin n=1 Tax=unclassified Arcicella TaxID=2644986 RepID=UPI00285F13F7|nr:MULTISPECIES: type II toxin-antitoxin system HipA family toxin [unclassified Arcicella]MDR6564343.1 serine/threonine-protein kinase HipA [Arcicella sp. BE51]MDR6814094.1 serine/threonine-protein kinase HipA [Arcicella sp. BE140]MDR6825406.1 serine/threonine-protein kinase HipA [Arcicella sp. BE139]